MDKEAGFSPLAKYTRTEQSRVSSLAFEVQVIRMTVVYYDLETTGLNNENRQRGVQIVSIGAVTERGSTFHRYIIPTCKISAEATGIHGIKLRKNGRLVKNRKWKENALHPKEGLQKFMDWLDSKNAQCLVSYFTFNKIPKLFDSQHFFHRLLTIILALIRSF